MVHIDIEYQDDLHCTAVHGPSGSVLTTDAPTDNHGRGETFSPTDLVATGLGTCIATILGIQADQRDLDLEGTRVTVEKHMVDGPRRIGRLVTEVHLPVALPESQRRALESAARACPVNNSLHPEIDVEIAFHWQE